jgi:hypothetical protein
VVAEKNNFPAVVFAWPGGAAGEQRQYSCHQGQTGPAERKLSWAVI